MESALLPSNERERLAELDALQLLDSLPEQAYDDITFVASLICGTPIALMSLVDEGRQWFKSRVGLAADETPRDVAFCAHAILEPDDLFLVPDTHADSRFADNPLVVGDPSVRFYAGAPLVTSAGNALGTLCVIDRVPRQLSSEQKMALMALSRQVVAQLDLRHSITALEAAATERSRYEAQLECYQLQLEEHLAKIAEQSVTDPLTGIKNRRAFLDRLHEEVDRSDRYGSELSVALIDVDNFKAYNDSWGHVAGDTALTQIAALLMDQSRSSDLVARYGGEEFVIIFPNTNGDCASLLAERFRRSIERADWAGAEVTVSIGVTTATPGEADAKTLVEQADKALYRAKDAGRNCVRAARPTRQLESVAANGARSPRPTRS